MSERIKIFLLEDDIGLIDGLVYSLHKNGFETRTVRTVKEALTLLTEAEQIRQYHLLLLDVTLPDGTGFDVCEKVRKISPRIPIIFLTASDEEVNIIRGLDCGGDDYITKPFRIGELCSRIRALLRRADVPPAQTSPDISRPNMPDGAETPHDSCRYGGLVIDFAHTNVFLNGEKLTLTNTEYRLLCLLVRSAGRTVSKNIILNELWDSAGDFVDDNTLSVYIRRLREKTETDPSHPEHLITVRGFGYQWKEVSE